MIAVAEKTALSSNSLRRLIEGNGGFTICLGGQVVTEGVSVCLRPSKSLAFPYSRWNDEVVERWLTERHADALRGNVCIGGWLDPRFDVVWFDVVTVIRPSYRIGAYIAARVMRQRCVFDIGRRRMVRLDRGPMLRSRP
jgi:hypothetical protein